MDLIYRIKEAQKRNGWNDGEFCRRLGFSQSVWSRIQRGKRPLTNWHFLKAVGRLMPELRWYICEYFFEGGNDADTTR